MALLHTGIFGPGLHGKTTLARFISRKNYLKYGRESICLDPYPDESNWGKQAEVFSLEKTDDFWKRVWSTTGKLIFVDEGIRTIGRNKELTPVFTEIRHLEHKVVIIGHRSKAVLLPEMRDQITTLFLFNQTRKSVVDWVEDFADERLSGAVGLKPYHFLHAVKGGTVEIRSLSETERNL